jgi:DNA gyrase subunit A
LIFCTRKGLIKRTDLGAYANVRVGGLEACDILEGDSLLSVQLAPRDVELMLTSREGQCVRFAGEQVRPMGRIARGVRGIDVGEGDEVVSLSVLPADGEGVLLTATSGGYGKRTQLSEYPAHNRGGKGVIDIQTDERNGGVVGCTVVKERDQVMLITDTGRLIRMGIRDIRMVSRNTKGVRLMRLEEGERVVGMTRLPEADEEQSPVEGAEGGVTEDVAVEGLVEEGSSAEPEGNE